LKWHGAGADVANSGSDTDGDDPKPIEPDKL
jgi:hypothetical protein